MNESQSDLYGSPEFYDNLQKVLRQQKNQGSINDNIPVIPKVICIDPQGSMTTCKRSSRQQEKKLGFDKWFDTSNSQSDLYRLPGFYDNLQKVFMSARKKNQGSRKKDNMLNI